MLQAHSLFFTHDEPLYICKGVNNNNNKIDISMINVTGSCMTNTNFPLFEVNSDHLKRIPKQTKKCLKQQQQPMCM